MRIHVIGDEKAIVGFALVGIAGDVVTTAEEAHAALQRALQDAEVGIILITADVAQSIQEEINRLKMSRVEPIIVEIPASGEEAPLTGLRTLVQEALGIHLGGG